MISITFSITALLLHSCHISAQRETATDGSIVYLKTTEVQSTETYTISDKVYYSLAETTYWSQIDTVYPEDDAFGPAPGQIYTSESVVYVVMTEQIATRPYVSDDGTWSYIYTSFLVTSDTDMPSVAPSETAIALGTTTYTATTPSLSLATTTTESKVLSTSTAHNDIKSPPSNGLIAGCIIGGIAFIIIMLLTGWIIYLQRRMDGKTRSNNHSEIVPVTQKQKFDYSMGPNRSLPACQTQASYQSTGISQVGLRTQDPNIIRSPLEPHYARKIELSA